MEKPVDGLKETRSGLTRWNTTKAYKFLTPLQSASDSPWSREAEIYFCPRRVWAKTRGKLAHAQDIAGIITILFFSLMFRPEVSLSIIVKWNANRQGSEMEDHVQPIGLVFITTREWFSLSPKGCTRASECIECSEKFLFLYQNFQIDSKNQTC